MILGNKKAKNKRFYGKKITTLDSFYIKGGQFLRFLLFIFRNKFFKV